MKKLVKIKHGYYETRFVGGGIGDSGFRNVREYETCKLLVDDLKEVLEWFDVGDIQKYKDVSNTELMNNKEYYELLEKQTKNLFARKLAGLEAQRKRYRIKNETAESVKKKYPELYQKFKKHYNKIDSGWSGLFGNKHYNLANKYEKRLTLYAEEHIKANYPEIRVVTGYYTDYIFH